jgi:hypothetical protein
MSKQPDQTPKAEASGRPKSHAGAKEALTQDLARRIALMVGQFPDSGIAVTWENVIQQTKLRFKRDFRRNVLSQKAWGGRKLIAEAFTDAKAIQKRQVRDTAPKYANEPRSRLRLVVAKLQAENMALRDQLSRVRAQQYDEIYALLDTRTPLSQLVALRADSSAAAASEADGKSNAPSVLSIEDARAGRSQRENQSDVGGGTSATHSKNGE